VTRKNPTRDDVAALAGTSPAVVSYVINDGPRNVSPERRARVLQAMTELGYYPNAHARSLAATQTRTLGMIVPNISNAYFAEFALAVEDAAITRGRLVFLGNSSEDREREEAYISSFLEQHVDGIIFIGVALKSSIGRIVHQGMPVVVVDRAIENSDSTTISIDHRAAARIATEHLIGHGHRSIGCLTGPEDQAVAEDRRQGWADALLNAGMDPAGQVVLRSPFSIAGGMAAARELLQAVAARPTSMFVASDEQARGVIAVAAQHSLAVARDLALVSVDGTRESEFSNPALTTVRQPYRELAAAAVDSVLAVPNSAPRHIQMEAELVIRQSCGCP
jgi:LacI family transcriptional regulator